LELRRKFRSIEDAPKTTAPLKTRSWGRPFRAAAELPLGAPAGKLAAGRKACPTNAFIAIGGPQGHERTFRYTARGPAIG